MSLLMFLHEERTALILTDTLATTTKGEPFIFQSKAWAIPHLNMAVTVTGLANFGASWNDFLRSSLIARDIGMVDKFAPEQLRRIWDEFLAEPELVQGVPTCTIYHFGFPDGSDRLVHYVYRSTRDFASERWEEPGFGIKPEPASAFEVPDDLDGWVALAAQARAEQDARSVGDRIYIGGELYLLILQNWQSQIMRIHRFDDYEQAWLDMNARLLREEGVA
jgi:hypothetical protein